MIVFNASKTQVELKAYIVKSVNSRGYSRAAFAFLQVTAVDPPLRSQLCMFQQMFTEQLLCFPDQLGLPTERRWRVRNLLLKIPDSPEKFVAKKWILLLEGVFKDFFLMQTCTCVETYTQFSSDFVFRMCCIESRRLSLLCQYLGLVNDQPLDLMAVPGVHPNPSPVFP